MFLTFVMIYCCLCFDCCCNDKSGNEELVRQQQAMLSFLDPATSIHYDVMIDGDTANWFLVLTFLIFKT